MRRQIDTAYNNQGLAYLLTSYADTAGTQIVNQVENVYNGLGQLTQQYQAVTGAVDTATTPSVQYTYSDPSIGSRLMSMVYPNGRTIDYNYSGSNLNGALDNAIGRLDSISDASSGQILEQYSYLGLSTIVARNHPQTGINLTLVGASGSIGSGGDQYIGLDQFGRIADQNWVNTSTGQSTDNFTYSYDANSNVTAKNNLLNTAYSETYTYDQLNRLTAVARGGAAYQSWGLDAQGNWGSFTSNGSTQTRTANGQNQITTISGTTTTPTYNANGDMITDQNGNTMTYDAWNRLVEVKNSAGVVIAQYTYDARGYRISESYPLGGNGVTPGTTDYLYYDSSWQAIEVRTNGTAASNVTSQTVWSAAYVNAPVLQDSYYNGVLQANQRLYFQQDANWNTTSVVGYDTTTGTWNVVQRYVYSPYGSITILNADWSTPPVGTTPLVNNLYQGMALDPAAGLYYERARWYSPSLGTWISQDPLQYINGANTYQFVMGNPVGAVDPSGLASEGIVAYIGALGQPGVGPLPWGPPAGGSAETNFNNQVTTTTTYPGGGVQGSAYQLTPAGPAPMPGGGLAWFDGLLRAMARGAAGQLGETEHCLVSTGAGEELTPKQRAGADTGAAVAGALEGAFKYLYSHPYFTWSNMPVPPFPSTEPGGAPWPQIQLYLQPPMMPIDPFFPAGQPLGIQGYWG